MPTPSMVNAKEAKNDEFYTMYGDISKQVRIFKDKFKGKIVYCNCDNPSQSNFYKYFYRNFHKLELKELRCSYYVDQQMSIFSDTLPPKPKLWTYDGTALRVKIMRGDGDFRSKECLDILNDSDIMVTNPPFSLLTTFLPLLKESKVDFLFIGPHTILGDDSFFDLYKNGRAIGIHNTSLTWYRIDGKRNNEDILPIKEHKGYYFAALGPLTNWYTTFTTEPHPYLLESKYNDMPRVCIDGTDIVNIEKTKDLPIDYYGKVAVPITATKFIDRNLYDILDKLSDCKVDGNKLFIKIVVQRKKNK